MVRCFIGLGSNLGNSKTIFQNVLERLETTAGICNLKCSKFYETEPIACRSDRPFLNAVACFTTTLPLHGLFKQLEEIECALGKVPKPKDAPRLIDIDLLFYGTLQHSDQKITVPHPHWYKRPFVLEPLAELCYSL